jgi:hypothetical protein
MGALADELVDVLGDAFSARDTDAVDGVNGMSEVEGHWTKRFLR